MRLLVLNILASEVLETSMICFQLLESLLKRNGVLEVLQLDRRWSKKF